ncbi:DUF4041 domain-containing protein [Saccharothrix sp. NPDC042600]|uniref:DUF4041 domain-containing protein n=1 Tax=Saccharothrix TaxID=2071 RepID=UPI0033DDD914|nr:hypothetical protein GCM10017745_15590 [Saccharothrix mutabilis subsp. capreolus]
MAKLMLRAYNAEADNAVRSVKPHTRESVKEKLSKTRETVGKLGALMGISISLDYHRLRLVEIDLTADHLVKAEYEREEAKAHRVISNIGAFGPDMVKIGMTRRLDPMDRVRELGDASVPFRFDTHALFFSTDAVALETALHQRLAHKRVNLVNARREFFYPTPAEVRELLLDLGDDHVLEFTEAAEAVEWRASDPVRRGTPAPVAVGARTDAGGDGDLSDDGGE